MLQIQPTGSLAANTGIRYYFRVQYEWDDAKAADNLRKHGVDFVDAIPALEDPNRLEDIDDRFEYGEDPSYRNGSRRRPVCHRDLSR